MDKVKELCKEIELEIEEKYKVFEIGMLKTAESNYINAINSQIYYTRNPVFLDETYLYLAILRNNIDVVRKACVEFAFRSFLCKFGRNAISYAVEYSDFEIVKVLVENNFPVLNLNGMKANPIIEAHKLGLIDVSTYLLQNTSVISPYHFELLNSYFVKNDLWIKNNKNLIIRKI